MLFRSEVGVEGRDRGPRRGRRVIAGRPPCEIEMGADGVGGERGAVRDEKEQNARERDKCKGAAERLRGARGTERVGRETEGTSRKTGD